MSWEGSTRRQRLPKDWSTRRLRVLRRDSYRCKHKDIMGNECGEYANQVDHIKRGDDHSYENLQSLCRKHHAMKSSREGNDAHKRRRREAERHPGLVEPDSAT